MVITALARRTTAPGPPGQPLVGHLEAFKQDPIKMLLDAQNGYGDVVRLQLGPYLVHAVSHPRGVQHVLQDNHKNYCRGRFYARFRLFFGLGLLTSDGRYWLTHRRIAQPVFHRRVVELCATAIVDTVDDMLERWREPARQGRQLDIVAEMMRLSLSVLGKAVFKQDLGAEADVLNPAVRVGLSAMIPSGTVQDFLPPWLPTPHTLRVARARRTLRQIMSRVLAEHGRLNSEGDDLVSLLLSARDEETGDLLSEEEVFDEITTIFLAGHETTGTGLAWALHAISKHPEVARALQAEVETAVGSRRPTLADVPNLPYTRMVVDEALRLYPPIWGYTRDALEDDEIGGFRIPRGSTVFISPYVTHRHTELWDNPEAFDPHRFAGSQAASRPRFAYFPFGGGPRKCIGNHLALLQMQLAVAMIMQRYHLAAVPGQHIHYGRGVSLRPATGIQMALRERQSRGPESTNACPYSAHN